MLRISIAAALGAAVAIFVGAGASAQYANNLAACEAAHAKKDPNAQIRLYTLCIDKGNLLPRTRAGVYNFRGAAYLQAGEIDKALADFDASISGDPEWGSAYLNRGKLLLQKGDLDGAQKDLTAATTLPPAKNAGPALSYRGQVRQKRGDYAGALADFRGAVKEDKSYQSSLAWLLATCPDSGVRNGEEAMEIAERIVRKEDSSAARDTLAAAYAETGRFDDAMREEGQAIAIFKGAPAGAAALKARLALYRSGKPYRDGSEAR
jgi:tetratricopeptide (TPR) repeat protein